MIAILGPPPLDMIRKSERSGRFWDDDGKQTYPYCVYPMLGTYVSIGNWIAEVPIPDISLETAECRLEGEEKKLFLTFMRKMLQWRPEDRGNCNEVFFDEWLLADLIEAGVVAKED